jgi:hypothetical protein
MQLNYRPQQLTNLRSSWNPDILALDNICEDLLQWKESDACEVYLNL